jgi:hypothetical protein
MIAEIVLTLALMIGLQVVVYGLFLRPRILTWGASKEEVSMPLIGDDLAPRISSTRAIAIEAPVAEVWRWVIQLGADRGGFFSYAFIEKALGYEMREPGSVPEVLDMEVGRIVPGSIDESKSVIKYNFPVVAVEPGKAFVLEEWGAFVLKEVSSTQTRLIVRTHGQGLPTLLSRVGDFIWVSLHYIMERRMLMGFKARAETGVRLSSAPDNLWLLGQVLSGLGIALLIVFGDGIAARVLSIVYGIAWLWTLLLLNPRQVYSLVLLVIVAATLAGLA